MESKYGPVTNQADVKPLRIRRLPLENTALQPTPDPKKLGPVAKAGIAAVAITGATLAAAAYADEAIDKGMDIGGAAIHGAMDAGNRSMDELKWILDQNGDSSRYGETREGGFVVSPDGRKVNLLFEVSLVDSGDKPLIMRTGPSNDSKPVTREEVIAQMNKLSVGLTDEEKAKQNIDPTFENIRVVLKDGAPYLEPQGLGKWNEFTVGTGPEAKVYYASDTFVKEHEGVAPIPETSINPNH